MNQFIIATHATLAEGFFQAVKFFSSAAENIEFLNCYVEHNEVERDLREMIEKYSDRNLIVLTDLAGGSVNQCAAKLMREYRFHLVSGINLALLLELIFTPDDLDAQMIENTVEQAKCQMVYMNRSEAVAGDDDTEEL